MTKVKQWSRAIVSRLAFVARIVYRHRPNAEAWSALAAAAAAITAYLSFVEQRATSRAEIQPELILSGWEATLSEPGKFSTVRIDEVRNIGSGPAFGVVVEVSDPPGLQSVAGGTVLVSVLARDAAQPLEMQIRVDVPAPRAGRELRALEFAMYVRYSDRRGHRYRTTYEVLIANKPYLGPESLGPNVVLENRRTTDD